MELFIGAPVWAHKGWVGTFFPRGTPAREFLHQYARRLTTVEGNTTFYAVPAPGTVQQWADETPESFRFCFKVPRSISHAGNLADHIEEAASFIDVMRPLGPRLGPMFLQLPPSYSPSQFDDLHVFLKSWPADQRLAVEVRHLRWYEAPFYERLNELLTEFKMARIVIDTRAIRSLGGEAILSGTVYERLLQARERKPDLPIMPERTADFTFLRYIGHPQVELNSPYLDEWVDYLVGLPEEVTEAYVFCHTPGVDTSPSLCREFYARAASRLQLASLLWDTAEIKPPEQPRLL